MKLTLPVFAVLVLGGCAQAQMGAGTPVSAVVPAGAPLASGECFRSTEIRGHTIADASTMLIDVRGREVYRVGVGGRCFAGATASDPIVTRSPPGSQTICRPIDLDLAISVGGFPATPCIVNSITRLTPEEAAALPKKLKP